MKSIQYISVVVITMIFSIASFAQMHDHTKMATTKTETIKVWGNCALCQARIEKAAKIEGVIKASWNKDTKLLTMIYNPSKVTSDDVQRKIANAGHDTEKFKANDKIYNRLPECCKYTRKQ